MKKTRWNPYKFKENVLEPIGLILVFLGMSIVWF